MICKLVLVLVPMEQAVNATVCNAADYKYGVDMSCLFEWYVLGCLSSVLKSIACGCYPIISDWIGDNIEIAVWEKSGKYGKIGKKGK